MCAPARSGASPSHCATPTTRASRGPGLGSQYSHAADWGVARPPYLPDELVGTQYYQPTGYGNERDVAARLEKIRAILRGE